MTTKTETKAIWTPVDTESMGEKLRKSLEAYKAAQKVANAARDDFNTAFIAAAKKAGKVPDGHTLLISHKFGQTSVSLVKDDQKASKGGSKPKFSF
jgi:hypothetical protein